MLLGSAVKTVLLVEDDGDIRETVSLALGRCGYEVVAAANGAVAFDEIAARATPPDLILLDWMMPVMSGLDFLTEQDRRPALRGIPVVVLSAVDRVLQASGVTVAAMLTKPVRLRTLVTVIDRLCGVAKRPPGFFDGRVSGQVSALNDTVPNLTTPAPTVAIRRPRSP